MPIKSNSLLALSMVVKLYRQLDLPGHLVLEVHVYKACLPRGEAWVTVTGLPNASCRNHCGSRTQTGLESESSGGCVQPLAGMSQQDEGIVVRNQGEKSKSMLHPP